MDFGFTKYRTQDWETIFDLRLSLISNRLRFMVAFMNKSAAITVRFRGGSAIYDC